MDDFTTHHPQFVRFLYFAANRKARRRKRKSISGRRIDIDFFPERIGFLNFRVPTGSGIQ
jgi:hypothetical protein